MGTLAGALAARGVDAFAGGLEAHVEGDIEQAERTIRITTIRVRYTGRFPAAQREEIERAVRLHPLACPAHESVKAAIRIEIGADFAWS
ncbi:MAG: OsmC family protein [Candidatus Lambdaproteobacteria bacterium]|nr:OsmC family protein [Candidatus Lambdaproteobacteria bacterium]